ncbi:MAG: CBS domain-containing protein [Ruminococcaceae bacterium]|nr:CBS domain-containing protein [Oscillospiraceae bacterium]MBR3596149.1 CBS domain-containing protein [Clostridia bacterium]
MNILRFLTPKVEVEYIDIESTVRQGLEKMKYHGYAAIPVIDSDGKYKGTVTEGDFLWALYNNNSPDLKRLEKTELKSIIRRDYQPVKASASIDEILSRAYYQNFVPVVDDRGVFIGIIKRKDIIKYLAGVKVEISEQPVTLHA